MPGKKENNDKNYLSRKNWLESKKKDRPKQVWKGNIPIPYKVITVT